MTEKLEAKAVEMLDAISAKMAALATQYGPEVVDAGLAVARLAALKTILVGFVLAAVAAIAAHLAVRIYRNAMKQTDSKEGEARFWLGTVPCTIASIGLTGWAIAQFCNVYAWAGLFDPKLYIAARVLGLV